jgi:hypothetical protein
MENTGKFERDHIFISYAVEDGHLAEWLFYKLTEAGYKVWMDRFRLIPGCEWPEDIDKAIKTQTACMIHLLSHASIDKPNPKAERLLGLNLSRQYKDFVFIPLNVCGLTEVPWQLGTIQYIPFQNWGTGLASLTSALAECHVPCPLQNEAQDRLYSFLHYQTCISNTPETLRSNVYPFTHIPSVIYCYEPSIDITEFRRELARKWAFYSVDKKSYLAFEAPSDLEGQQFSWKRTNAFRWEDTSAIFGIPSVNIATNLIRMQFDVYCRSKGLYSFKFSAKRYGWYFPNGLLENDRIYFTGYQGKTHINIIGTRRISQKPIRYHLAFYPHIECRLPEFFLELQIRIVAKEMNGGIIADSRVGTIRKKVAQGWFNHALLLRQMAIASHLFTGEETEILKNPSMAKKDALIISSSPLSFSSPFGIDQDAVSALTFNKNTDDVMAEDAKAQKPWEDEDAL